MFTFDIPDIPQNYPAVMVAQANQDELAVTGKERAIGRCIPSAYKSSLEHDVVTGLSPGIAAAGYFYLYEKRHVDSESASRVEVLVQPKHGQIAPLKDYPLEFDYIPDVAYVGNDKVVLRVHIGGTTVRVVYLLKVTDRADWDRPEADDALCKKSGIRWKISDAIPTPDSLQSLLTSLGLSSLVQVETADLTGSAVGSTTGPTITLDTNAAGHGWFFDYTPYLNEEFLPTSNPYEWVAKPGSEAEGKMDLYSVLLHEYGHIVGLDHSADGYDFMAATLQPGVRRRPSAESMALLAELAGDPTAPADPSDPNNSPLAPASGTTRGTVRTGRMRIDRFGATPVLADGTDIPQYEVAANPTLADAKLETGTGWETGGTVAIGNGAAVLTETTASQTRFNQIFIVGPNDRYFTVADAGLDDVTNGPSPLPNPLPLAGEGANVAAFGSYNGPKDAFEAALLDANTGAALFSSSGLTRNDAFLNRQADGTGHAVSGITRSLNADGSRTYRVDLSGIPAGDIDTSGDFFRGVGRVQPRNQG